jgi:acetamidase/formamidase
MLKRSSALLVLALTLTATAALAAATKYGQGVTLKEATPISALIAAPGSYAGKAVAVKGLVVGVCAHSGCWMDLASDKPYERIRVKVEDGKIVFPPAVRGRQATVQGVIEAIPMCPEEATAYRQQEAKAKGIAFSPSMVTGSENYLAVKVTGALVE